MWKRSFIYGCNICVGRTVRFSGLLWSEKTPLLNCSQLALSCLVSIKEVKQACNKWLRVLHRILNMTE